MKFTIEVEQASPQVAPAVRVTVDGKDITLIERIEFVMRASDHVPKVMVRLSDVSKLSPKSISGADSAAIAGLKSNVAHHKKLLSNFPWIDLP